VRNYKRKPGSRNYKTTYTEETLSRAVTEVKSKKSSVLAASKRYKIPYGTLYKKSRPDYQPERNPGRPRVLASEEEALIIQLIEFFNKWKFPLSEYDIRVIVQSYLDKQGRTTMFKNNLPGYEWIKGFIKRHNLTSRVAANIKPNRAEITPEVINNYFANLAPLLENVPASNIFNYDETNITDDPGKKQVIVRRGLKRIERSISHSKQATSVMFCGSADGKYLPPMIVFKAKNHYQGWTRDGPTDAVYDHSVSGWFDSNLFQNGFTIFFSQLWKNWKAEQC